LEGKFCGGGPGDSSKEWLRLERNQRLGVLGKKEEFISLNAVHFRRRLGGSRGEEDRKKGSRCGPVGGGKVWRFQKIGGAHRMFRGGFVMKEAEREKRIERIGKPNACRFDRS